jgi:hypothetical protein
VDDDGREEVALLELEPRRDSGSTSVLHCPTGVGRICLDSGDALIMIQLAFEAVCPAGRIVGELDAVAAPSERTRASGGRRDRASLASSSAFPPPKGCRGESSAFESYEKGALSRVFLVFRIPSPKRPKHEWSRYQAGQHPECGHAGISETDPGRGNL